MALPDIFRKRFLSAYHERRDADMFLAGFFTVRPENISDTAKVVIDVVRENEEISPVVNEAEGPTLNLATAWTTKEFEPPTISEAMPFDVREFLKRMPGVNEYDAADMSWSAQFFARAMDGLNRMEQKIRRNREWQASQILQTGKLDLVNAAGTVVYQIDFKPKATHTLAAGTAWDDAGAKPLSDIELMLDRIRADSLQDGDRVIMGDTAFNAFMGHASVQSQFENRRFELGVIAPRPTGVGGKYQGILNVGNYQIEIWTYNGRGLVPGAGSAIKMVTSANVIVMASGGRLDTVFGGVPMAVPVDPRFAGILPSRISIPQAVDIAPNIWVTPDGKQTMLEVASKPLLIPTGIDTFGTIATGV